MYEFHAWFGLAETTSEMDAGHLSSALAELKLILGAFASPTAAAELIALNGQYFVSVDGFVNRRRNEGSNLDDLLVYLAGSLPGSWGVVYERDDESLEQPGPNAFRVRVLARGAVTEHSDPFLSPCRPTIED